MASLHCTRSSSVCSSTRRAPRAIAVVCKAQKQDVVSGMSQAVAAAFTAAAVLAAPAGAITYDKLQGLTYLQVKGSGIANTCPEIADPASDPFKALRPGSYKLERFCMEPTAISVSPVAERHDYLPTKLLTRNTYTLDAMEGKFVVGNNGAVQMQEEDGLDYAAVTVRLPGGEPVPMMFTIKGVNAVGTLAKFEGTFTVPSYRGSSFMDPRGRGASTGYETAIGLDSAQEDDHIHKDNNKKITPHIGRALFSVTQVDTATGEIAGVFETVQPTDDDMGAKPAKEAMVTGKWYGHLEG